MTTMLQVSQASPAVESYRDRLGLDYVGRNSEGQDKRSPWAEGRAWRSCPTRGATTTGRTEMSFEVSDIGAETRDRGQRGVTIADDDMPGLKTVEHVDVLGSAKAAWFEDPDGNVLCRHELLTAASSSP